MFRNYFFLLIRFSNFGIVFWAAHTNYASAAEVQVPLTLSLESAMDMAESYSFTARIAQQTQDSNESQEDVQLRSMLPNITLSGQYFQYNPASVNSAISPTTGIPLGSPSTTSSASFILTQHLVGLIPLYLAVEQASAQTLAALQNKQQAKLDARFLGAKSFINAQKSDRLLRVAESSVDVAEKQLHDAQAQFDAGKLINADVLKFKLNLENSKTLLVQAQTTYKVALVTLAETIGVKSIKNIILPRTYSPAIQSDKIKLDLDSALQTAMTQRNDGLAAQENINAARYGKQFAISSYLPTVDFVSNYTRNFQQQTAVGYGLNLAPAGVQDSFYYGIQFTWNLLDWGVRQAQISSAAAGEHSAKISEEQVQSQIRIDVTNSYLQLQAEKQVLDSTRISAQYAEDVYTQFKAQFDNGQVTATDLISASVDQTSARANYANAMGDMDLAVLALQRSMGQRLTSTL